MRSKQQKRDNFIALDTVYLLSALLITVIRFRLTAAFHLDGELFRLYFVRKRARAFLSLYAERTEIVFVILTLCPLH